MAQEEDLFARVLRPRPLHQFPRVFYQQVGPFLAEVAQVFFGAIGPVAPQIGDDAGESLLGEPGHEGEIAFFVLGHSVDQDHGCLGMLRGNDVRVHRTKRSKDSGRGELQRTIFWL